jgi:hypothetical protein
MSSTRTISCGQECSRYRWQVPGGYTIAAHAFAWGYMGRVWSLSGRREV